MKRIHLNSRHQYILFSQQFYPTNIAICLLDYEAWEVGESNKNRAVLNPYVYFTINSSVAP